MYWKTGAEFRADHEAFRLGLVKYAVRGNNRLRADVQQVTPFFWEQNAAEMHYNNIYTRIALERQVNAQIARELKSREGDLFMLSASPRQFRSDPETGACPVEELQRWVARRFLGLNYFGVIEGAWYGNYNEVPDFPRPYISWHCHVIVWGANSEQLRAIKEEINRTEQGFVWDKKPGHFMKISRRNLFSRFRYLLKAPIKEYRLIKRKPERGAIGHNSQSKSGRTGKRDMRPGAAVRLMTIIGERPIDDFIIAGGEGEEMRRRVLTKTRRVLERRQARR